jgi:hypothetical protein
MRQKEIRADLAAFERVDEDPLGMRTNSRSRARFHCAMTSRVRCRKFNKLEGTMASMFETRFPQQVTAFVFGSDRVSAPVVNDFPPGLK